MFGLIEIFNSREIAWAVWISIGLVALIWFNNTRSSLWEVVKSLFIWTIIKWWISMVIYIASFVYIFYHLGLWTSDLLKDTVFYIIFSASITFLKANKISEDKHFFREMLKDNLKLGILLEFVIGLYTFSIWVELLIVPLTLLLVGVQAVSGSEEKYKSVNKLINWIWITTGTIALYHIIKSVILHFQDLLSLDNLRQILLTPNLTLIYIPFLYILSLRMDYETQFVLLGFKVENKKLKRFSRWQAIINFRTDLNSLKRWVNRWNLSRPQTREEVLLTIRDLKSQQQLEKKPPIVPLENGWSPYIAKDFLPDEHLKTGYYDPGYEEEWTASSPKLRQEKDWSGNSISYRIKGTKLAVNKLELVLSIFEPKNATELLSIFKNRLSLLFKKATDEELPIMINKAIEKDKNMKCQYGRYTIEFEKEQWGNTTGGYDLIFSISIPRRYRKGPPLWET